MQLFAYGNTITASKTESYHYETIIFPLYLSANLDNKTNTIHASSSYQVNLHEY